MAATPFDPNNLRLGAGILYYAPIGSTEPVDLAASLDAAWVLLGATIDGNTYTYGQTVESIFIAEEVMPVRAETSKLEPTVEFELAEATARNWQLVMNGGTLAIGAVVTLVTDPNANLSPTERMILWQAADAKERYVFRRCVQTNAVAQKRNKAPQIASLPLKFNLLRPATSTPLSVVDFSSHILLNALG